MHQNDPRASEFLTNCLNMVKSSVPGYVFDVLQHPDDTIEILSASDGTKSVIGLTPDQVKADWSLILTVIHPADLESFVSVLQTGMRTGEPIQWEGRALLADGQVKWIRSLAVPSENTSGGRVWAGMTTDITELKQIELEERRANGFFQMMLESGPCVFFVRETTPPYLLAYVSDNAKGPFLVKSGQHMVGEVGNMDAVHPDDRATMLDSFEQTVKEGKTTIEFRSGDPVKGYRRLVSHKRISESDPRYMIGIAYDVTEHYQLERAIKRLETTLRTMIESSPTCTAIFGQDGSLNFANKAALALFELPLSAAIGVGWLKAVHRADRNRVRDIVERTVRSLKPRSFTCRFVLGERETTWCRIELEPSQDVESSCCLIATFTDVTSQRETEFLIERDMRKSMRMHEAQEEANKAMLAELFGPLSDVLSRSTTILEQWEPNSQADKEGLRTAIEEAIAKIDSFFVMSIENLSLVPLQPASFDVAQVVSFSLGTVGGMARFRAIEVRCPEIAAKEVWAFADEARIKSVFTAILKGCVLASPIEGILCIDLKRQGDKALFSVSVTATDSGVAILAPLQGQTGKRHVSGLALELAVAKRLSDAMGGTLNLETTSGHVTVTLELPSEPSPVKETSDSQKRNLL